MAIEILPATGDRFDDSETALDSGDGPECQCQWWMLPNGPWKETSVAERSELFRAELDGDLPPGLIAYVDGEPAGWVRVGPRTTQPRLARTRNVTGSTNEPLDDDSVWAVTCFVVRKAHRGSGLMRDLLDAAVEAARDGGARVVEGYPREPSAAKIPVNDLYLGTVSIFEAAGFTVIDRPKSDRALVSLTLRD
ncbi:GNAT family N-acetyltransferase [Microbacterium sp. RURRCA19A]|uniref:GNAT family N-acetyltransferase n=1 Tax=Microbacterium sp. RURRCA19A TaxID=1907391 RepID=UPI000956AA89|nr:GNAT family N-acetyltransferase [Microbacterium sp. RURRCA19A]SIR65134.1 Acetyltransferase (GNAT) family protein [Microbacterium sp. RURRCA19A]